MSIDKLVASIPSKSPAERLAMRNNAMTMLQQGSPEKIASAKQLIERLDAVETQERDALMERLLKMPDAERVALAFTTHAMSETERKVIQALLDNPGATSETLSKRSGWDGNAWHLHFGMMCKHRKEYLWQAPDSARRDAPFFSGILANFDQETSGFTMQSDARKAFAELGLHPRPVDQFR